MTAVLLLRPFFFCTSTLLFSFSVLIRSGLLSMICSDSSDFTDNKSLALCKRRFLLPARGCACYCFRIRMFQLSFQRKAFSSVTDSEGSP